MRLLRRDVVCCAVLAPPCALAHAAGFDRGEQETDQKQDSSARPDEYDDEEEEDDGDDDADDDEDDPFLRGGAKPRAGGRKHALLVWSKVFIYVALRLQTCACLPMPIVLRSMSMA